MGNVEGKDRGLLSGTTSLCVLRGCIKPDIIAEIWIEIRTRDLSTTKRIINHPSLWYEAWNFCYLV